MNNILLSPPVVFVIILVVALTLARLFKQMACRPSSHAEDQRTSYACGEDLPDHLIQPDFSQFFPFAFFFTILHVVALMLATVPKSTPETFLIAIFYILAAITGLTVLWRK
jgi:NADH:ubiquinone oxidoreductase subunit 3 (subunit A)